MPHLALYTFGVLKSPLADSAPGSRRAIQHERDTGRWLVSSVAERRDSRLGVRIGER